MKAMLMTRITALDKDLTPLILVNLPTPKPQEGEILVKVKVCGVCHTELDEIEGRACPPELPVVPGHEVVGIVAAHGPGVFLPELETRVGIGWIHCSTGHHNENLAPEFRATGRDVNGGYAEYMVVPAAYACPIPDIMSDIQAAPLLCAGAIGYRALRLTNLQDGDNLGLTGFGGSAHIVLQLARYLYPHTRIFIFARDESTRQFAKDQGADWVGHTEEQPPQLLHAIIDTTPAWLPVLKALDCLGAGGRLVINAIRKNDNDKSELANLSYHRHLWMEKEIKSVANITFSDITKFLPLAARIPIIPRVQTYPLAEANEALVSLKHEPVHGAKALIIEPE